MNNEFSFHIKKERPEDVYEDISDYFTSEKIKNYSESKAIFRIQTKITARALELLNLTNESALLLDAGCGPGFSSFFLKAKGYQVVGFDMLSEFFDYYELEDINPIVTDMCQPPFRREIFDGIISISALQWIFRDISNYSSEQKFIDLIRSFFSILKFNSKIVFQFYPKNSMIMERMRNIINTQTDFTGAYVIDNPNNPKKRDIFLVLNKIMK